MQRCNVHIAAGTTVAALFAITVAVSANDPDAARDEAQTGSRANRLVTGPDIPSGTIAGGAAHMELRWLDPATDVSGTTVTYPPGTTGVGTNDLTMPGVPSGGQTLFVGGFISNWGPSTQDSDPPGALGGCQFVLYAGSQSPNPPDPGSLRDLAPDITVYRPVCSNDAECFLMMGGGFGSGCDVPPSIGCAPAYQWEGHPLWETQQGQPDWAFIGSSISTDDLLWSVTAEDDIHVDDGRTVYIGTWVLRAAETISGIQTIPLFAGATGATDTEVNPIEVDLTNATISIPPGSCCYDIGLSATTLCASGVTQPECEELNSGPFPPVFREGEACPENGGPACPLRNGACCNTVAGPLAQNGVCTDDVAFGNCRCSTCTWFDGDSCDAVIADGRCEADFVTIPTVSEWGLVIITLGLLITAKLYFGRRSIELA